MTKKILLIPVSHVKMSAYVRGTKAFGVEVSQLFHGEGNRNDVPFGR